MKKLRLVCHTCGTVATFRGSDANAVMQAIDEDLWSERPDFENGPGWMAGTCPSCNGLSDPQEEAA